MVYVTGDIHGDLRRFSSAPFRKLRRGDTLLVAGDFGFVWDGSARERRVSARLGRKPYTILFLDGAHENHAELAAMPTTYYAGAAAHRLGKRLYHIRRGQVLLLEGKYIFVMGGGESNDRELRREGVNWWPAESPSEAETAAADELLGYCGDRVDYIVTHEPPQSIRRFLQQDDARGTPFTAYLDELTRRVRFSHWFFGSLHRDKRVTPLYTAVFKDVVPLK